jgi:voltage-gated potassium channel
MPPWAPQYWIAGSGSPQQRMNSNPPTLEAHGMLPWLARRLGGRELTARRSLAIITTATAFVTVLGGLTIRLFDSKDFSSIGQGLWWAVQTVTTVGYGDVVPQGIGGRLIATVVMLTGIAFISLITASVTATLVEQTRGQRTDSVETRLDEISARLDAIEGHLGSRGPGGESVSR